MQLTIAIDLGAERVDLTFDNDHAVSLSLWPDDEVSYLRLDENGKFQPIEKWDRIEVKKCLIDGDLDSFDVHIGSLFTVFVEVPQEGTDQPVYFAIHDRTTDERVVVAELDEDHLSYTFTL